MVTPPDAAFDLHLPGGMASVFQQRIAAIPEGKRNAWRYHRVASGDSLTSVAREYHVTEAELASANQLRASDGIENMEALLVPAAPLAEPAHAALYTVRRGDTLVTIADRFGVSLNELRRWNRIPGIKVQPGMRLHLADPESARHTAHHRGRGAAESAHTLKTAPTKDSTTERTARGTHEKSATAIRKKAPAHHATGSGSKKKSAKRSHK
jgi:membrane-bound lytic murein transglycosylase D